MYCNTQLCILPFVVYNNILPLIKVAVKTFLQFL
uniref:Uncharacterized protein n=1 Tax=Siphoviridae sp. ctOrJ23 TaxID=2825481 RepID=A0A8S5Q1H0_9CAUD|nr:MAG TPA: hypothetical protein [Siphoviridae sp. ctOrJ23]